MWVKVVSKNANRLGLSMRDVDQATGEDLLPMGRGGPASNPAGPTGANAVGVKNMTALHGLSGIRVSIAFCTVVVLSAGMLSTWYCARGRWVGVENMTALHGLSGIRVGTAFPFTVLLCCQWYCAGAEAVRVKHRQCCLCQL